MAIDWRPTASIAALRARARLLSDIREYFQQTGALEVETPVCSRAGTTDPAIESFSTRHQAGAEGIPRLYLHTSPEFAMKRLLAAGSGAIYQICRVFRAGESGRMHNPEFTLLEWYRPGFDHHRLMDDVAALILSLLPEPCPVQRLSYRELFIELLGLDPHNASIDLLKACAMHRGVPITADFILPHRDAWLDLLMSHCIEPALNGKGLCFIYDYPASQASLARVREGDPAVAERFELYWDGVELANGFHELSDAEEQARRFAADRHTRAQLGQADVPADERLLAALEEGLPACAGVALGVDRLLMKLIGAAHIDQVLAFPVERA